MKSHKRQTLKSGDIRYILGWTKVKIIFDDNELDSKKVYCEILEPAVTSKFSKGEFVFLYRNLLYPHKRRKI